MPTLCLVEVTQLRTKAVDGRRALFSQKKWKASHFILSRRQRDFHQILHGDRGGPCAIILGPKLFLGPVHSFAARGPRKFGWKRRHRSKLLIILSSELPDGINFLIGNNIWLKGHPLSDDIIEQAVVTHSATRKAQTSSDTDDSHDTTENELRIISVSYTHLTLPTIYSV